MVPGFLKTVGIVTQLNVNRTPSIPGLPKQADRRDYEGLQAELSREFEVRQLDIKDGVVPPDIDVLIVGKPPVLTPKHQYAIDQYLMRGGAVIFMAGTYQIRFENGALQTNGLMIQSLICSKPTASTSPMDLYGPEERPLPFRSKATWTHADELH